MTQTRTMTRFDWSFHVARRAPQRSRGWFFKTKQPHHFTWLIALALAILGLVSVRVHIDYVSQHSIWFGFAAYIVLALGTVIDGI